VKTPLQKRFFEFLTTAHHSKKSGKITKNSLALDTFFGEKKFSVALQVPELWRFEVFFQAFRLECSVKKI